MEFCNHKTTTVGRCKSMRIILVAVSVVILSGCKIHDHQANLGAIYDQAAQRDEVDRNPIIVIPGILGSKLVHQASGDSVWGIIGGKRGNNVTGHLPIPMRKGLPLSAIEDGVVPDGVLDRIVVKLGAPISVKEYAQLLAALGVGGYRDESLGEAGAIDYGNKHYTCFQFSYDWRRSSAENAAKLDQFIQEKRRYVAAERRKRYGRSGKVKFDIVAHSMGGLVARYYMRYGSQPLPADGSLPNLTWAGASNLEKVILVATPNGGSTSAVKQLLKGYKPSPLVESFPAALLGTMPSIYELIPRTRQKMILTPDGRNLDLFKVETWTSRQLGLADPHQDKILQKLLPEISDPAQRRSIAREHLSKCLKSAAQFQAAMDRPAKRPHGTSLYLFAGDSEPTLETLEVSQGEHLKKLTTAPGDGTVTRASALLDGRKFPSGGRMQTPIGWTNATFIADRHLGLTRDPAFIDNVLHLLLER